MVTTEFHGPAPAGEGLTATAAAVFHRVADFWRAVQNRRSVGKLLAWDARMLRDIGLTPYDVQSAMAAPVGSDPSSRLDALSAERRHAMRAEARHRLVASSTAQLGDTPRRLASRTDKFTEL